MSTITLKNEFKKNGSNMGLRACLNPANLSICKTIKLGDPRENFNNLSKKVTIKPEKEDTGMSDAWNIKVYPMHKCIFTPIFTLDNPVTLRSITYGKDTDGLYIEYKLSGGKDWSLEVDVTNPTVTDYFQTSNVTVGDD
jgi:hypothetical protein